MLKKAISIIVKYVLPMVIGVWLFYFLYQNVDLEQMRQISSEVNYWWFVPVVLINLATYFFRSWRWQLQLRAIGVNPPYHAILNSIFGTYAVNLLFPRLGEVWRTGYIAQREKASFTAVFGSMMADRLSDTLTVALIMLLTLVLAFPALEKFFITYPAFYERLVHLATSPVLWGVAIVIVLAIVLLVRIHPQSGPVAKVKAMAVQFWNGFSALLTMPHRTLFVLLTIGIWGGYFMQMYFAFYAFDFTADLGVVAALVVFVLSSIGMAVPTNGGLGAWHVATIFGLSIYGVGTFDPQCFDPRATAFAAIVWGIETLEVIVLGIYALVAIALDKGNKPAVKVSE